MYRLLVILLLPFFVVGNSLAHSHGSAAHPSPSEGRAHFHFVSAHQHVHDHHSHGHSHHRHSHDHDQKSEDSKAAPIEQPIDHDSDAVYIAALDFMATTSDRTLIEARSFCVVEAVEDYFARIRPSIRRDHPQLATTTELPLYLLHAALRL